MFETIRVKQEIKMLVHAKFSLSVKKDYQQQTPWATTIVAYKSFTNPPTATATSQAWTGFCAWKKVNAPLAVQTRVSTVFPRDCNRTYASSNRRECSEPNQSQSFENIRDWRFISWWLSKCFATWASRWIGAFL